MRFFMEMEVVLFQPQIPANTGNIVRTCQATGTKLTLVKPLGFSLSDRQLKRAGLDYWHDLDIQVIDNLETYLETQKRPFYCFSSKVKRPYTEIHFEENPLLIFGSETSGLPAHYFTRWEDRFCNIPILPHARCLNLSNCVAIGIYEVLRQHSQIILR